MLDKTVVGWKAESLYHGLASELLLYDKEELRMFWRMNTDTYEVSKFVLIGRCATRWSIVGNLTDPQSGRKTYAVILTPKHCSRELTQNTEAATRGVL